MPNFFTGEPTQSERDRDARLAAETRRILEDFQQTRGRASVYVVTDDRGNYKVGASYSPSARCASLQTGNPRPLRVVYSVEFSDRSSALEIESSVHLNLSRFRTIGEWFKCSPDEIVQQIRCAYCASESARIIEINDRNEH